MLKIFNFYHKPAHMFQTPFLIPMHAGKAISKHNLNMIGDNTNINISHKNRYYGELTGMYWVWKNIQSEYIGFCHYRRYFNFYTPRAFDFIHHDILKNSPQIYTPTTNVLKHDIIVPQPLKLNQSIESQYIYNHRQHDWEMLISIIKKKYPNYSFNVVKNQYLYPFNMFISKYDIFIFYMEFLFDLLFELESKITLPPEHSYQSRVFGFIGERLLNIFIDMVRSNQFPHLKQISIGQMQTLFVKNYAPLVFKNNSFERLI